MKKAPEIYILDEDVQELVIFYMGVERVVPFTDTFKSEDEMNLSLGRLISSTIEDMINEA